jgi:serine/threonine-protein kinase HipA
MTSDQAYVWVWLPGAVEPVVAGVLKRSGDRLHFAYGRSYLARDDAIALSVPELPLQSGEHIPEYTLASCLRDAAPDAWGRRVIVQRLLHRSGPQVDTAELDELTYLLESGSDRIGALDFQHSATEYEPRLSQNATLDQLLQAADLIQSGEFLPEALLQAIQHGTSIGGARPKAQIDHSDGSKWIAKFATSTDIYNIVKAEFVAMRLAHLAGLDVATVRLSQAAGRDVLLVKRFDRDIQMPATRKIMVSALTIQGLHEMQARYASYEVLGEKIRHRFTQPGTTLSELFRRMVFNILVSNTDDHARNHAAFWDGRFLSLTPAYDICPQLRTGREAGQAMRIHGENNLSRISTCLAAAPGFNLKINDAQYLIDQLIEAIEQHWPDVAEEAALTSRDRELFRQRLLLPDGIFD